MLRWLAEKLESRNKQTELRPGDNVLRPEQQLELRPGMNVIFGQKLILKVRVWREKEQRWHDLPDQVTDLDGAPR